MPGKVICRGKGKGPHNVLLETKMGRVVVPGRNVRRAVTPMTDTPKTCFTCRHWKADEGKLTVGTCALLQATTPARQVCIRWEEPEKIEW